MIEFIIPLNLPVRSVVATELTASPPEWLAMEMTRWANRHQHSSPSLESSPAPHTSSTPPDPVPATVIEHELEQLRAQRSLFKDAVVELRHATKLVEQRLDGLVHEFQEATIELAHAISAKLIFEEVDRNRFPVANLVHEVVSRLDVTANAVVRLHPDDLALMQEQPTIGDADSERSLRFIADSTLARGDCKAKAGEISVIYELRRQIDEIRRQLLSTVNGHAET